jgi:hypothetical protein
MMAKLQISIRISDSGKAKLDALAEHFGNQTTAIEIALDRLYQEEMDMASKDEAYTDLQSLTGHESGALQYEDGSVMILNWASISGIPRTFVGHPIGLGETLVRRRTATPYAAKKAMQQHEREQGTPISQTGFRAWQVYTYDPDTDTESDAHVTVVVNSGWV